jgi:hypothetical protein
MFDARMLDAKKFDARKFRPHTLLSYLLLFVFSICILSSAQDKDKDKDSDKDKDGKKSGTFVDINKGKVRCDKPEVAHSIEVPDRPGHALMIEKRKCMWTEPMVILGGKTKDGIQVGFAEQMEGTRHSHGFETDTLDNGEKLTWKTMDQVSGEKGPATITGRWSLMRGTGKYKGIKGGGTYEGKLGADDVLTLEFDGVYDPSEMVGDKK